jgi:putative nucleotidyltransferase with HDIG domain
MAKVLVVAPDVSSRFELLRHLKGAGHEVTAASDMTTAMTVLERDIQDVIISDTVPPDAEGRTLLGLVRERFPELPVLLVAANPDLKLALHALRHRAADVLDKPVDGKVLCGAINALLRPKRQDAEFERLLDENRKYQQHLESIVRARTAELARNEAKLQAQFNYTPVPTTIWQHVDQDFVLIEHNDAAARMTSGAVSGWIGARASAVFGNDPAILAMARDAFDGRTSVSLETPVNFLPGQPARTCIVWASFFPGTYVMITTDDVTERRQAEQERDATLERISRTLASTIQAMASTVEARDLFTAGHQRRVAALAQQIAGNMGIDDDRIEGVRVAGIIHDVGKIAVPAEILSKPSRLNPDEMGLVQVHAETGYEILRSIEFPWPVAEIVRQHHERMDGSGYPLGLKGDEIRLESRILAVADVVEAICSHRPYRPALGLGHAMSVIRDGSGTLYDPEVVAACESVFDTGYVIPER